MQDSVVCSQIRAALKMVRNVIETCPDGLWDRTSDHNPFWALAYHTLYFAHLYLSPSLEEFEPFVRSARGHDGFGRTDLGDWSVLTPADVYAKDDILAYLEHIDTYVCQWVESTSFDAPSGFHWLKFSKAEAHLYNLRHIQHHAGQLAERLRQEADLGSRWVFKGP